MNRVSSAKWVMALGIACAIITCAVWLVAGSQKSARGENRISASDTVQQTIIIRQGADDGSDRVVFTPPPEGSIDKALTASEALAAFKSEDPQYTAADNSTPQLGSYTASSGPDTYRHQGQLAWGFSTTTACPLSPNPFDAASPSGECTDWLFLDARTGEMLEEDLQPASSS